MRELKTPDFDINVVWQNIGTMTKIKNGSNPAGKTVLVRCQVNGNFTWHKYNVLDVTGAQHNAPANGSPVVFMQLAEKNPEGRLQEYISLPLSAFGQRVLAESDTDKFWEFEKGENLKIDGE